MQNVTQSNQNPSHSQSITSIIKPKIAKGPKGRWLVGSLPERRKNPIGLFMSSALTYGPITRIKMGPMIVHLVSHPDYLKAVLMDHKHKYIKGFGYDKLEPVLGNGLLTSEGDFWHRQRKLSQPAFHRQTLDKFSQSMFEITLKTKKRWETLCHNQQSNLFGAKINVLDEMMHLTLGVVSETLLSSSVVFEATKVSTALNELLHEANRRILSLIQFTQKLPSPRKQRMKRNIEILDNIVYGMIKSRRSNPQNSHDLLSLLMNTKDEETGEQMNDKQLRDEVMTIFLAGHETTANALSWIFYLLASHPEIEKKLLEELKNLPQDRPINLNDLRSLIYTTMVIEEGLRLYPPAWILSRQATQDDIIDGYLIPKDSIVVISPYVMHHHPMFWENPEAFNPERFHPSRKATHSKFTYIPFSAGPRQCIGNNFALMEMQIALALLVPHFKFELVPGHKVEVDPVITLKPKNGIFMHLKKREPIFTNDK